VLTRSTLRSVARGAAWRYIPRVERVGAALLDSLDEAGRRSLLARTVRRRFRRGETLFHAGDLGDTFHFLEKGHIAIRITTPLGDGATFTVLAPGDAFGEQALLHETSRRAATAVALDAVETRALHRDEFEALRRANPEVDRLLVTMLAASVRNLSEQLVESLFLPVEKRIARRLLALVAQYDNGHDTTIPLTQDDLASLAGTTRPTTNRVLRGAEADGILAIGRGRVEILDVERLARWAR
jgi:CRP-like cAMP-binding protein